MSETVAAAGASTAPAEAQPRHPGRRGRRPSPSPRSACRSRPSSTASSTRTCGTSSTTADLDLRRLPGAGDAARAVLRRGRRPVRPQAAAGRSAPALMVVGGLLGFFTPVQRCRGAAHRPGDRRHRRGRDLPDVGGDARGRHAQRPAARARHLDLGRRPHRRRLHLPGAGRPAGPHPPLGRAVRELALRLPGHGGAGRGQLRDHPDLRAELRPRRRAARWTGPARSPSRCRCSRCCTR